MRRHERPEQRQQDHEQEHSQSEPDPAVPERPPYRSQALAVRDRPPGFGDDVSGAHARRVLRRGTSRTVSRSATRFTTTYTDAKQQDDGLNDREIATGDSGRESAAEAGICEEVLDCDDAAGEVDERERRALDDGDERVAKRVPADDGSLGEPFQTCHLDVVGLEHVDHRGSLKTRQVRQDREHERDDRQREFLRVSERGAPRRDQCDRRQHR